MSNITCYDSDNNVLETLYQWDDNQTIRISGLDIPSHPVFHFCNRLSKYALIVNPTISGSDLVVKIPNSLLRQAETIFAYLYQDTQDGGHRTSHAIKIPVKSRLKPSTDEEGEIDVIEEAERRGAAAQKATDCLEIAESLTTCDELNGFTEIADYASMDWQNLRNQIESTSILTDEKQAELQSYSEIRSAAAQTENKNPVEMIGVWKAVEDNARIITNRIPLLSRSMSSGMTNYRLPWLPTIALTGLNFNDGYVNPNCLEYGFDCSSMKYNGLSTGRNGLLFWNYGAVDTDYVQTEKIKITNMQSITIASDLFYGWQHVTDIELTGCSNFSEIKRLFSRCSALVNITGDPIDLSHITTDTNAEAPFYRCYSLKEIRLAADSLSVSLSLTDTHSLSEDSIISILNAAGANGSGKTITFSLASSSKINGAAADAKAAAISRGWQIALA